MKSKKSKQELTRLILTALILGNGSLYGPVAEASGNVTVEYTETFAFVYNTFKGSERPYNGNQLVSSYNNIVVNGTLLGDPMQPTSGAYGGGSTFGGFSSTGGASAVQNTVTINNGARISYNVYGGYADGQANQNTVTINGGQFTNSTIYGGLWMRA